MSFRRLRLSFTEYRRCRLATKVDRLDRLESRTTITEPVSIVGLSVSSLRGLVQLGLMSAYGGSNAPSPFVRPKDAAKQAGPKPYFMPANLLKSIDAIALGHHSAAGAAGTVSGSASNAHHTSGDSSNDWLSLSAKPTDSGGVSKPWHPAKGPGGGPAQAPRGGTSASRGTQNTARGTITPLRLPPSTPSASAGGGASAALLAAVAGASGAGTQIASPGTGGAPPVAKTSLVHAGAGAASGEGNQGGGGGVTLSPATDPGPTPSGGSTPPPGSTPDPVTGNYAGFTPGVSAPFGLYVLDNQSGVVLQPGVQQLATLDGWMDLIAQVQGATVSSYSWNTSGLPATLISGTSTDQLNFRWDSTNEAGYRHSTSVTLSVTDTSLQTLTYTYDFWLPEGTIIGSSGGGTNASWATSLAPSQQLQSSPPFASDDATVDANSGSLDTQIDLPSYNPNVPALALTYDSITAKPEPIITVENTIPATVPSQVSAQLTFNGGTALTKYYYNTSTSTSTLNTGDVQQINLQATNATSLSTGRYTYSAQVVDIGSGVATMTFSGGTNLLNYSSNAFGAGWTLQGLEQITSASGGVILDLGDNGRSLWFTGTAGSGGGVTYTSPPGEFDSLVKASGSGGAYTLTQTDGTQITFNSSGLETSIIDLNGSHTTYSYSGGNLTSIEDYLGNDTDFTYSGGYLQSIEDPASRFATFTHSGGNLTEVELPDASTWNYSYASGGQMTQISDPLSHTATINFDSGGRVSSINRPDSTTEDFTNDQEAGWTNSGTSGSPAPSTLLAVAGSTYTSPNSNTTTIQPDWMGLGLPGNIIDPLGNDQLFDRNSNGLPTVTVDQVNRNVQYGYDSKGDVVSIIYEDTNEENYTYNSDAEPLTYTNADGYTTSYTYSSGNLTVVEDALTNLETMTYTSTGQVKTTTDANNHTTTYLYDSQDRETTVQFPDGTTNLYSFNSQGNVTKFVDNAGNATTYSFDALGRETRSTNALNGVTTLTFDSGGNLTVDQEPTPSGGTARTNTYSYDSMNRLTTMTAPLSLQTVYGYDSDGNQVTVKDPIGRVTTTVFDALDRPTVVIDPLNSNRTTTTYDGDSEVIQVDDAMNRITTTTYDNRGWVATSTDPLGNTSTYSYTATGQESTYSNPMNSGGASVVSFVYDKDDRLIAETDANGNTTTITLDGVGNQIAVTDANSNTTSYAYDSMNRLTTVTAPISGDTTVYGYSGGNQITVTDGLGHTTTTQYDALNRATTITSPVSGGTTVIAYDAAGREISLTDPDNNKTQWAFDADDRVTTETLPNSATVTYVYDNDGELTDTTDADGRRTTYSYDADGDQTGETWVGASPSEKITYTYDADNELTGADDAYATLTFTYDSGGNELTSATSGPGTGQPSVTLTSTYNPQNDLASVTDNVSGNVGITTYLYDAGQRLTTITTSYGGTAGPEVITSYAANNQISAQSRTIGGSGTSVNTSYSYDAADRQTTITDYVSGGSALATYVYSYDNANRVTTMVDAEGTYTYTYDNGNELTSVHKGGTQVESYAYDANGNRTGTGYSTTVMNETLTSPGVITYTYDNAGNMISADSGGTFTTYTYDYRNRLTEVKQGGTLIATYTYNALDQRIGLQDSGGSTTWTIYNGTSPDALPYGDFNGSGGGASHALRLWPGNGQWRGRRRVTRSNEFGGNNSVVLDRQARFGSRCGELGRLGA